MEALEEADLQGEGSEAEVVEAGEEMDLSTPRFSGCSSSSIRIQAEGLDLPVGTQGFTLAQSSILPQRRDFARPNR